MKVILICLLGVISSATAGSDLTQYSPKCPLWTAWSNKTGSCVCGSSLEGIVTCDAHHGAKTVQNCYCMTTREQEPVVSSCILNCLLDAPLAQNIYAISTEDLNNHTCGPYNRTGVLCGECVDGYGVPVYSYSLACVECSHYKYNWLKYIAVAYIPLTLFYFLVILFRLSATSGTLIGLCYSLSNDHH